MQGFLNSFSKKWVTQKRKVFFTKSNIMTIVIYDFAVIYKLYISLILEKKYSLWLKPLKPQQYFHLRNSQSKLRLIHQNHYQNRSELWYSSWFSPLEALLVFQFFLHLPCICGKGFVGYGHRAANGCIYSIILPVAIKICPIRDKLMIYLIIIFSTFYVTISLAWYDFLITLLSQVENSIIN